MRTPIVTALIVTLLLASCQVRPRNVLSRSKMLAVTQDVLIADAYISQSPHSDSVARLMYEQLFAEHDISRATYDSSLVWYAMKADQLASIYEEVDRNLKRMRAESDTIHADSLRQTRVRFAAVEDLWPSPLERIAIPAHLAYYPIQQRFILPDSVVASDTLAWSLRLLPALLAREELILSLTLLSSDDRHLATYRDTLRGPAHGYAAHWCLPDSLPPYSFLLGRITYQRSSASSSRLLPLLLTDIKLAVPRLQLHHPDTTILN